MSDNGPGGATLAPLPSCLGLNPLTATTPWRPRTLAESDIPEMHIRMHKSLALPSLLALSVATWLVAGCSSGSMNATSANTPTGTSFVIGTDAPMDSVTSFSVQLQSITATDAGGNTVQLISGSPTVDFARFNGLQTLLSLNNVPVGTYTNVTVTLGPATIGYLDTSSTGAPTIQTMQATLTTNTVSVTLKNPLVVANAAAPVGLHVDFSLRKSIQVDSNGQITGQVTPTFIVDTVGPDDSGARIDEYTAAVVSVDANAQTFVLQGPHGTQITVAVNGQTEWDDNATLSDLIAGSSIVQISGKLDMTTGDLDADEIDILSQEGFYASGQVTYVTPASGAATNFDLYVRGLLPATTGLAQGQIATVDLTGNEKFSIYWMHDALTQFLFNSSTMLPGQDVAVGGPASGATDPNNVSVHRVVLRDWGFNGTIVPGSVNTSNNTFQMQVKGFAGILIPETVTVYIAGGTEYRDGLGDMSGLDTTTNVRVVGVLLKDPATGNAILVAHYVDSQDN